MSLKQTNLWIFFRLLKDYIPEIFCWIKYCIDLHDNSKKIECDLTIRVHAIEKGMSLGHARIGFGQQKAIAILNDLERYISFDGNLSFVVHAVGVLSQYIKFNGFTKQDEIVRILDAFCNKYSISPIPQGGIEYLQLDDICNDIHSEFDVFSQSRHAIRDFGSDIIDRNAVDRALKLCERTPSACNRQSWHIYVLDDKEKRDKLLEIQGGVNGCENEIQSAIVICSDMRNYGLVETNLPYIDGGLYAMNLMYALHHEGLANIPLSMSYNRERINKMKCVIGIPEYELPVLLIAIGAYKEKFKVAISERKCYKEYTTIL